MSTAILFLTLYGFFWQGSLPPGRLPAVPTLLCGRFFRIIRSSLAAREHGRVVLGVAAGIALGCWLSLVNAGSILGPYIEKQTTEAGFSFEANAIFERFQGLFRPAAGCSFFTLDCSYFRIRYLCL